MNTIWFASLETRNFSFDAHGNTRDNAIEALRLAWNEHLRQAENSGVGIATFEEIAGEDLENIHVDERTLNQGYRDKEPCGPAVDTSCQEEPYPDSSKLRLPQLYTILQAAQKGTADAKSGIISKDYAQGTAEFKSYHMAYNMQLVPGKRPF